MVGNSAGSSCGKLRGSCWSEHGESGGSLVKITPPACLWTTPTSKIWLKLVISSHRSVFLIFPLCLPPLLSHCCCQSIHRETRVLNSSSLFWNRWWFICLKMTYFCWEFEVLTSSCFLFCLSLPEKFFHTWYFHIMNLHSLSWHHLLIFWLNILSVFSCSENSPLSEHYDPSVPSPFAAGH